MFKPGDTVVVKDTERVAVVKSCSDYLKENVEEHPEHKDKILVQYENGITEWIRSDDARFFLLG